MLKSAAFLLPPSSFRVRPPSRSGYCLKLAAPLLMLRGAKAFDYAAKDGDRFAKFGGGDELAGAVCAAYVAGAEDDRVRAQLGQLRRFRAERDRARRAPRSLFERAHERRLRVGLHPAIEARHTQLAVEVRVLRAQVFYLAADEFGDRVGPLTGHGPPFEREAALARDDVLGRAARDESDVDGRKRRVERVVRVALQLLGDALDARDESRGARDGRRARRGVRAVPLAPAHAHVCEAVALARAYGPQGCRLAHDGVPHAEGAGLRQAPRAENPRLPLPPPDQREPSRAGAHL